MVSAAFWILTPDQAEHIFLQFKVYISYDIVAAAQRKLARKGCDLIVANDISRTDAGFEVDENAVLFVWPDQPVEQLPLLPKSGVAAQLFDRIEKLREGR